MTSNPSDPTGSPTPAADDTAAFQRFYFEDEDAADRSVWYRIFVGWWRDRR